MNKLTWSVLLLALISSIAGAWFYRSLDYDFKTLDGKAYRWQQLQGQWVVLNYFAEWCAPCLREVPELNAFYHVSQKHDNLQLFAINYDGVSDAALVDIKNKYQMAFPLVTGDKMVMPNQKPEQLPATFIISPDGQVKKRLLGEQSAEKLLQAIELLERL